MTVSKKMINAQVIEKNANLVSCPICSGQMALVDHSRLVCVENHSFDLSKQGYVNLAPQAHATKYDKSLFAARKQVIESGFFDQLLEFITKTVSSQCGNQEEVVLLDAGCGEGSHLNKILSQLTGNAVGIGIDLAKEGITSAAKEHPGSIWAVADLANCPFQDEKFDVILNILSPANYAEFIRLLKPGGLFLKVVPEEDYLKELRDIFYEGSEREKEKETNPVERVADYFESVLTERITYKFKLEEGLLAPLIRMTPLTWGATDEKIAEAHRKDLSAITIDYNVIIGRKKSIKKGAIQCSKD